jgi:hypothetical protein
MMGLLMLWDKVPSSRLLELVGTICHLIVQMADVLSLLVLHRQCKRRGLQPESNLGLR